MPLYRRTPLPCSPGLGLLQRERKNRCPSSGIAPERRNRWHGATGPLEVAATSPETQSPRLSLPGNFVRMLVLSRKADGVERNQTPARCSSPTRHTPLPSTAVFGPGSDSLCPGLGVSRSKADFLPYGPNAGISGRARSFASPEMCLRHPLLVMCLTSWP